LSIGNLSSFHFWDFLGMDLLKARAQPQGLGADEEPVEVKVD
jgi:hypothetical protein